MKTDHEHWRAIWQTAQSNMPWWTQKTNGFRWGQTSLLMRLLGYKSHASTGSPASLTQAFCTCVNRGVKPKDEMRRRILEMLAGPHSSTFVRAIAIQRGIRPEALHALAGEKVMMPSEEYNPRRVEAIKQIRAVTGLGLRETLRLIADEFNFPALPNDPYLAGWKEFMDWQDSARFSLESVQGPHALTLLKMLAIKHGRKSVSEQPK